MKKDLLVAVEFFKRDFFVQSQRLAGYIKQYSLLCACLYGICFGYLLPLIGFGAEYQGRDAISFFLIGTILYVFWQISFAVNADFMFDFERDRVIDYQLTLLSPRFIIGERIFFSSIIIFLGLILFYPVLKLIFYTDFNLSRMVLYQSIIIFYLTSLLCAAVQVAFACYIRHAGQMRVLFRRITYPMIMLGGFLVPWKGMFSYSPLLGYVALLNPLMYVTEGLRGTMLGSDHYFSFAVCAGMLLFFSLFFTLFSLYRFKKKVDHI
jgi:ABC-2 type transport system permease protein